MHRIRAAAVVSLLLALGCGGTGSGADGGPDAARPDGAVAAPVDAAADSGMTSDAATAGADTGAGSAADAAATDADAEASDAVALPDASAQTDTGAPPDATAGPDASPPPDASPSAIQFVDDGPDQPNGLVNGGNATSAGMAFVFAGDVDALYLVPYAGGLWVSHQGANWEELLDAPARTISVAVDPLDPTHLAVGEREGDFTNPDGSPDVLLNDSGVYESFDAGLTWTRTLDPAARPGGCRGIQAVPSLAFDLADSTLIVATACGIAVRPHGGVFDWPAQPIGPNLVTAVTASPNRFWARNAAGLVASSGDHGATWIGTSTAPAPPGAEGDAWSLAAFDGFAFLSTLGDTNASGGNNYNQIAIYDLAEDRWILDTRIFDPTRTSTGSLNGTGGTADGRRSVRAEHVGPAGTPMLIFNSSQEVYTSTVQDPTTHRFTWTLRALTPVAGGTDVHADIWDVHASSDGTALWLAGDGGVARLDFGGRGPPVWVLQVGGLHTHTIHSLFVANRGNDVAYATTDNAGWYLDRGSWIYDATGDSNAAIGDLGASPIYAMSIRNPTLYSIDGFGAGIPHWGSFAQLLAFCDDLTVPGSIPRLFNFVPTLAGEFPASPLDAIQLVQLPFRWHDSNGFQVALDAPGSPLALIRNPTFVDGADVNRSHAAGWTIATSTVPAGAIGFLVSGGHATPTVYVIAQGPMGLQLYAPNEPWPASHWTDVTPGEILTGNQYDSVWVDPAHPDALTVLTSTGVRVSSDGGASWTTDPVLTALVTPNGMRLTGAFAPNRNNVEFAQRSYSTGSLSDVAYDRYHPAHRAVANAYGGVFFTKGDGVWHDVSPPHLKAVPTSLVLDGDVVYVATEGRGLLAIRGLSSF
jgi:hypothetical protein